MRCPVDSGSDAMQCTAWSAAQDTPGGRNLNGFLKGIVIAFDKLIWRGCFPGG